MESQLSLENSLKHRMFMQEAEKMSREQAIDMLDKLYRTHLASQETYRELIGHKWGFEKLQPVED